MNIVKNVDIGTLNSTVTKNSSLAYENNRKSPREKSPMHNMFDNINSGSQMIGGFDFTFYARKKGQAQNKFNDNRNNFIL